MLEVRVGAERGGASPPGRSVTFVALNYPPSVGGAQTYISRVATGLAALGHDVEVLTTDALRSPSGRAPGRIPVRTERLDGVRVRRHRVPLWARQPLRALRWASVHAPWAPDDAASAAVHPALAGPPAPALLAAVRRALVGRDVVVGCSAPFTTLVAPARLRSRTGGARVVALPLLHLGRDDPHRQVADALRRSDASVALTAFERDVHVALGLDGDQVAVLPPGVEEQSATSPSNARSRMGLPERPTVGYVGRLASYKGIDTLLDAAPELWRDRPDLTVLVAGASTGWRAHRSHPASEHGGENLIIREDVEASELPLLLAACDVVVYPSRDESFGIGILEAWAAGRPVVAADIDAVRDVVSGGGGAELVAPGDHRALAVAVAALLDDPDRALRMGAAGRAHVERSGTWSETIAGWDALLDEAVA